MVKVLIHTDTRYPVNRKIIRKAVEETLKSLNADKMECEVSVAVVGKRKMKEIGGKFIKDDKNHQVLAFPFEDIGQRGAFISYPDNLLRMGEIILCWAYVLEEASADDMMVDDKIYELTGHAVEHLLGKHHE